ncbi:hypothetical protein QUA56_14805 [Microcoleus sp. N3A4]|uniref:hypothetical protein n=1 Tax=Microcoleus sp. N3A4 TaxID=3055379 RepID=UPI002FD61265
MLLKIACSIARPADRTFPIPRPLAATFNILASKACWFRANVVWCWASNYKFPIEVSIDPAQKRIPCDVLMSWRDRNFRPNDRRSGNAIVQAPKFNAASKSQIVRLSDRRTSRRTSQISNRLTRLVNIGDRSKLN